MDVSPNNPSPAGASQPVPHRTHSRRSQETAGAPGFQPDPLVRLVRMVLTICVSALAMLLVFVGAGKYLQRDWADKNQRARAQTRQPSARTAPDFPSDTANAGRPWTVPASSRDAFLATLAGGPAWHFWLIQGFAPNQPAAARGRAMLLDLAEHGDSAQYRNLCAALLLKHGDAIHAVRQLRAAERIAPGYPPTLFNRALCALMSDLPEQALAWLVRYRARFPAEPQAIRLHYNLLLQLDRAPEAMDLLDRYLATQPPSQPLLLDAALQAAQLNRVSDAIRYLETAQKGQSPAVIARIYQSPAFREIRLSPEGTAFAERLARRARASLTRSAALHPMTPAAVPSSAAIPVAPKFH